MIYLMIFYMAATFVAIVHSFDIRHLTKRIEQLFAEAAHSPSALEKTMKNDNTPKPTALEQLKFFEAFPPKNGEQFVIRCLKELEDQLQSLQAQIETMQDHMARGGNRFIDEAGPMFDSKAAWDLIESHNSEAGSQEHHDGMAPKAEDPDDRCWNCHEQFELDDLEPMCPECRHMAHDPTDFGFIRASKAEAAILYNIDTGRINITKEHFETLKTIQTENIQLNEELAACKERMGKTVEMLMGCLAYVERNKMRGQGYTQQTLGDALQEIALKEAIDLLSTPLSLPSTETPVTNKGEK